jgi:FkbM family methyltransferase
MFNRIADNLWLIRVAKNFETFRAMKGRLHVGADKGIRSLQLRALDRPVVYRPETTDISVVWELFRGGEYAVRGEWPFKSVMDCGANVGMFLAWLISTRKVKQYVGIEADGSSFDVLERQIKSLGLGREFSILHAAVWERDGEVSFDSTGPSWGRHVASSGGVKVAAKTIKTILNECGLKQCDLVKIDIEGGELSVLPTINDWGACVKAVVVELHGSADFDWFSKIVTSAGFRAYPAGVLFHSHPGALREDAVEEFRRAGFAV